jgi:prepilin-type N-terminal cleavage/methylation domain-containing protein
VPKHPPRGITLIETMVVLAIIGALMSLLLMGVSAVRESARLTQCSNNMRQLGLATQNFLTSHRHFPGNGWGYAWIGQLDRGVGPQQPGGWAFQILPFAEILLPSSQVEDDAVRASWRQLDFSLFRCPNRPSGLTPHTDLFQPRNALVVQLTAKTDYAICEGDFITNTGEGPLSLAEGDSPSYRWPKLAATGISYQRSQIRPSDVRDGLSLTYALGEKHVAREAYSSLGDLGYDQSLLAGVDLDLNRWVINAPLRDSDESNTRVFGSAHAAGWNAVMCDGSVRRMAFGIDPLTHARLGNRLDGRSVSIPE